MATFKLTIADPKESKTYQKEVKDAEAAGFLGLNIGESIKGDGFGLEGYEFEVTGGSDFCGFPMRKGILGVRKKITSIGGVGFPGLKGGKKLRRTVCGQKINDSITQVNMKVTKAGSKKVADVAGAPAEDAGEGDAKEDKKAEEKPKEDKKEAPKEEKAEAEEKPKGDDKKEEKPKEDKAEDKKAEEKPKAEDKN